MFRGHPGMDEHLVCDLERLLLVLRDEDVSLDGEGEVVAGQAILARVSL